MRIIEPRVCYGVDPVEPARRPETLEGGVLGFLDGWGTRRDDGSIGMYPVMDELRRLIVAQCHISDVVHIKKAKAGSPPSAEEMDLLVTRCTAVINGICLSGGCTAGSILDAVELEKAGIPTVTLCHSEFERIGRMYAANLGLSGLPLLVYQPPVGGNIAGNASELARERVADVLAALIRQG